MGNSLQDQLLKAGLVNQKQVKKVRQEKSRKRKKKIPAPESRESSIAREERLAFEQHNRELNAQRNLERKKREAAAQIRQMVKRDRLTLKAQDDDVPYHYIVKKRIKKMFVPPKTADQLTEGKLAIVNLDGQFELIPADTARQVAQRDPKVIVVFHEPGKDA